MRFLLHLRGLKQIILLCKKTIRNQKLGDIKGFVHHLLTKNFCLLTHWKNNKSKWKISPTSGKPNIFKNWSSVVASIVYCMSIFVQTIKFPCPPSKKIYRLKYSRNFSCPFTVETENRKIIFWTYVALTKYLLWQIDIFQLLCIIIHQCRFTFKITNFHPSEGDWKRAKKVFFLQKGETVHTRWVLQVQNWVYCLSLSHKSDVSFSLIPKAVRKW